MSGESPQEMADALRAVADAKDNPDNHAAHLVSQQFRRLADELAPVRPFVIRIVGLVNGYPCPFDRQWLAEYDPTRSGTDPAGNPMTAHITVTPDPRRALRFPDAAAAHEAWTATSGRTRPDGQPDRPLTAFNIEIATITALED
jgi:hypothetical protein